ncbi:uncharacterized protein LOC100679129 isoform X1 [Nasonia vitripennis]|uniref:Uncharacterized protein n=1 Tax=Nasonia vitripennis TaxID=7425 RepID=A0A7M7ILD7_NASVI|nr:uncharacterized protein LOC100679129 isoform X1 [Nasonia vitripennis]XP_031789537.1 uncharacterized protein LOC100679129 isoform X1 [Nasonia vitripennis]XP_031789538.1 uncharacterized protein LOC100679129 isoform X1 [Nasonia vitripennis]XP_031789539.1 uncharacterized protein LOC100679129 isoform X1 [Nasonia vitripennis]
MSRSNIGNASSDLPPSYDEVCSTTERRGSSPSTSRKTKSTSKSKNNKTAAKFSPTAPPRDILENTQVPEPTRLEDTSIPINDGIDDIDSHLRTLTTRINTYQQIPQGLEPQNNARLHQRLRRNISYNGIDDGKVVKYIVYTLAGVFAVFFIIVILNNMPSSSYTNYLESEEHLKYKKEMDRLFEGNDYLSGRRDMKKDGKEFLAKLQNTTFLKRK